MADSDNTTTLSLVTRWKARTGKGSKAFARNNVEAERAADSAVLVWAEWQAVHRETDRLCRQQQSLERKLLDRSEFPCAADQARWEAADDEDGYSRALRAESEAGDHAMDLLRVLSITPASTLAGVAAKLDAVLREGQPSEDDAEFPWPLIRSALEDLIRIGPQAEPAQLLPGRLRQASPVKKGASG